MASPRDQESLGKADLRRFRIKKKAEFNRIFKEGRRYSAGNFIVLAVEAETPQYGIAVSRVVGNAVKRNLARRRLRVAVRHCAACLPRNKRIVLVAKPPILKVKFCELESEVERVFRKIS